MGGPKDKSDEKPDGKQPASKDAEQQWNEQAETFVAIQVVHIIRQVFAHIQNMMTFLVAMLLCLLIGFQGYPFQPSGLITWLWAGLMVCTLSVVVISTIKFNRNEVLSHLSNTTPNRFTFDRSLLVPFLLYVVTPIVGLLSVHFPSIGRLLFGWVGTLGRLFGT